MDARARRVLAPALSHQCSTCFDEGSHAFAGRLPCPPVPWRWEPGDLVLGLTTHLHVLAVAVCSQIAHAIHRCVRCTNQRAPALMCVSVCVSVCVYVRVRARVYVCLCMRRTEMRARRTTTHDPRPACSAMQRPSLGGGRGAGGLAQYPISSISRCMVWSGLVWSLLGAAAPRGPCVFPTRPIEGR